MERLTEKFDDGEVFCGKIGAVEDVGIDETIFVGKLVDKLAEYEQAEEDGLLKMLPVAIGSDVYFIPSKANYDLNNLCKHEGLNRVYHQKVARIVFTERGWYIECSLNLQYGITDLLRDKSYKETWFTSKAEAEQALANMKEET